MKPIQNILLLVLIALSGNATGQESGWESDYLQGRVKTFTEYHYEFDISDSINHDEFMQRFYQCGFDTARMIRFADSIKTAKDHKSCSVHEYDSFGYYTKRSYSSAQYENETYYQNEYDNHGRLLKKIVLPGDTTVFKYDEEGRLLEIRSRDHVMCYRTIQWAYDLEGRLVEKKVLKGDSIQSFFRKVYDKNGVLRKSERFGVPRSNSKEYCEYDSRGNVVFARVENCGCGDLVKSRTRYKYDGNDSIIKATIREKRWWHNDIGSDDVRWQETDSTGQIADYVNYRIVTTKKKERLKFERRIIRNAKGLPIKEEHVQKEQTGKFKYNTIREFDSVGRLVEEEDNSIRGDDTIPYRIEKKKYDDLGRVVEEVRVSGPYLRHHKKIWRYYKDTDRLIYYATYDGGDEENYTFSHESLFFYDDQGNCIAHIQWMPDSEGLEYYFEVYGYDYYE